MTKLPSEPCPKQVDLPIKCALHGVAPGPLAAELANTDPRTVSMRFRHLTATTPVLWVSDLALWALLDGTDGQARELSITYLLRPGCNLEIDISVAGVSAARPLHKRALQRLVQVALPSCAPVAPDLPFLKTSSISLSPAGTDFPGRAAKSLEPGEPHPPLSNVRMRQEKQLQTDPAKALAVLAQFGLQADLTLSVRPWEFDAPTQRCLEDAARSALVASYAVGADELTRAKATVDLIMIRSWVEAGRAVALKAGLRLAQDAHPALGAAVARALFGSSGSTQDPLPRVDLVCALRPRDSRPQLLASPATFDALRVATASRPPREPKGDGIVLGRDEADRIVSVSTSDMAQHFYIIGATGSGKSSSLCSFVLQGAKKGMPHIVIDPHGELAGELELRLPRETGVEPLIADAADFNHPFTLNILDVRGAHAGIRRSYIANQLIALFKLVFGHNPEAFGPIFEVYWRSSLLLLMEAEGEQATLLNLDRVFGDRSYRKDLLERCSDPQIVSFWTQIAQRASGESALEAVAPYIVSKIGNIVGNPLLRPILCATQTSLDFDTCLAEGSTVLINLARGLVGGPDAALLGGVLTIRLFAAAMARASRPASERKAFRVVLDEFPTYANAVLGDAMAEVRKYGLGLVLANQSLAQIDGRGGDIGNAILANAGNLLSFRLGPRDAQTVAEFLGNASLASSLTRLPNGSCLARLLAGGVPQPARLVRTWK